MKKFKMNWCKPILTPMESNLNFVKFDRELSHVPCQRITRSFIYLSICTRKVNNNFSTKHSNHAKIIIRYQNVQQIKDPLAVILQDSWM